MSCSLLPLKAATQRPSIHPFPFQIRVAASRDFLRHDATRQKLDVGPLPRGGDGLTISATGFADNQTSGGSFKIIADAENWDNAVGLNTPGQSGNPDDPHYRDLFDLWAKGRYFPVAYSRGKVESVAESVTMLTPK